MNWETYLAFGDSITKGARTYLGYPELAGHLLNNHLSSQWNVVNSSVCGFKAIDLARHIDDHYCSLERKRACVSTILIGTNDIKEKTKPSDFKVALDQVILKAKMLTVRGNVIIMSIPSFHRGITYPYSVAMNDDIAALNAEIQWLAAEHNIRMLNVNHTELDFTDGVHLNDHGVVTFSDQVAKYILCDKGINLN